MKPTTVLVLVAAAVFVGMAIERKMAAQEREQIDSWAKRLVNTGVANLAFGVGFGVSYVALS